MLSRTLLACGMSLLGFTWEAIAAEPPAVSVVYQGQEGKYAVVRTPQLLVTRAGTLLAFAQGRSGAHDRSDNDIILKRSTDQGRTWSPFQVLADHGRDSLNSICAIQVRETGRLLVVGCWLPDGYEFHEFQYLSPALQEYQRKAGREKLPAIRTGYDGPDVARVYVLESDDDGVTWSAMKEITRETKRPSDILAVPGPGIAIQLHEGPHTGRIVVPCWGRWLNRDANPPAYEARPYAVFSDDRGDNWQRGELAPPGDEPSEQQGNEVQVVELPGGVLLLNARSSGRAVATSRDGGAIWSPLQAEEAIPTTPTAAGFLRFSGLTKSSRSRLLFSNPQEPGRKRGVISLSYDDGKTWPVQKVLREGTFKYSSLARLPDGRIGCIFDGVATQEESGQKPAAAVLLAQFDLDWLTDGRDREP